eukprot:6492505-Amphidinium_carterae.1
MREAPSNVEQKDRKAADWLERSRRFMRLAPDGLERKRAHNKKVNRIPERTSTMQLVKAFLNGIFGGAGIVPSQFEAREGTLFTFGILGIEPEECMSASGEDAWQLLRGTGHVELANLILATRETPVPPSLTMVHDEDGKNRLMVAFLRDHCGLNIVGVKDPMHRQWNDINLSLRDAGLYGCYLLTLVAMNAWFGPWHSKSWWLEAVRKLEEFLTYSGPQDPLFAE